jgi:hypothetical protein
MEQLRMKHLSQQDRMQSSPESKEAHQTIESSGKKPKTAALKPLANDLNKPILQQRDKSASEKS